VWPLPCCIAAGALLSALSCLASSSIQVRTDSPGITLLTELFATSPLFLIPSFFAPKKKPATNPFDSDSDVKPQQQRQARVCPVPRPAGADEPPLPERLPRRGRAGGPVRAGPGGSRGVQGGGDHAPDAGLPQDRRGDEGHRVQHPRYGPPAGPPDAHDGRPHRPGSLQSRVRTHTIS
jgi:hypothetical protein